MWTRARFFVRTVDKSNERRADEVSKRRATQEDDKSLTIISISHLSNYQSWICHHIPNWFFCFSGKILRTMVLAIRRLEQFAVSHKSRTIVHTHTHKVCLTWAETWQFSPLSFAEACRRRVAFLSFWFALAPYLPKLNGEYFALCVHLSTLQSATIATPKVNTI